MAKLIVFDQRARQEVDEALVGFVPMASDTRRKHITVKNPATGVAENVGILESDGSVEAQPGYDIRVE